MSKKLLLEIVTPDHKVLSQDVDYVGAPGALGEFGVLPSHIPFLSALGIGNLYYKDEGRTHYVFVSGGFAEVTPEKVTILAEAAEKAADIDTERARKAQDRAQQRLARAQEKIDYARAQAALRRSIARMNCRNSGEKAGTC